MRRFETTPNRPSRFITLGLLASALIFIPATLVHGQNVAKVEQRLDKLVEQGHLTQVQADAMMGTLKHMSETKPKSASNHDTSDSETPARQARLAYSRIEAELKEAVAAGKISQSDMEKRLHEIQATLAEKLTRLGTTPAARQKHFISREEITRAASELEAMVKAGKIKRDEMEVRLSQMKKAFAEQNSPTPNLKDFPKGSALRSHESAIEDKAAKQQSVDKLENAARRLKLAVESGSISKEEADVKMKELKAKMDTSRGGAVNQNPKQGIEGAVQKIRQAAIDGIISRAEAETKMKALMSQKQSAESPQRDNGGRQ